MQLYVVLSEQRIDSKAIIKMQLITTRSNYINLDTINARVLIFCQKRRSDGVIGSEWTLIQPQNSANYVPFTHAPRAATLRRYGLNVPVFYPRSEPARSVCVNGP